MTFTLDIMDLRVLMILLSYVVLVFSKTVDYYAILGVQRHADETEIRSAFKNLAKIWHPDKMGETESWGGSERFIAIREAYEVLSNSIKREIYDRNYPEAGIYKPWWSSLLSAWDELTISLRQSEQQRRIMEKSRDFFLQYELFSFRLVINVVFEVPVFMSKLENAVSNLKHIKREATYKIFHKRNWWDLENSISAKSVRAFIKILGLSSLCLISKYLSRVKIVQGLFFFGSLFIFPGFLAIYVLLLAWRKHAFVVAFALAFGETVVYRTFISPTLSDIRHDVDTFLEMHQTEIFIYIVVVTLVSFPVFLKYRTRCHFFPFILCAITSGVYLESSPELFALTIALMIICWPLSCFCKDSRKSSFRPWFLRRKAGADNVTDTHQNRTVVKEENDIFFTHELNFYFTLTAVCLSVMFIYEFY